MHRNANVLASLIHTFIVLANYETSWLQFLLKHQKSIRFIKDKKTNSLQIFAV